jgi:D-alanyl-D-alanine carboxypeptidase
MKSSKHPALRLIDQWLTHQAAQGDLPGFQVAIRHKTNLVFNKAYGFADLERGVKFSPTHVARIASHSKVFTSALMLLFESKGLLRLSDRLVNHLPELCDHVDRRFQKVTLAHLLSNRSGIFRDSYDYNYWGSEAPFLSRDELIREVRQRKLVYAPGSYTKYSNLGFALLGAVLEAVSGQSYGELVREHILRKLKGALLWPELAGQKKMARSYYHGNSLRNKFLPAKNQATNAMAAATGFCGNAEGISQFLAKLYWTRDILPGKQSGLLKSKKWKVKNLKTDRYGYGMIFRRLNKSEYVGHSGGFPGFASHTWIVPKTGYTFSFITNASVVKTFDPIRCMNEITQAIEKHFSRAELEILQVTEPMSDNFMSTLYVVGKKKALAFPILGWVITEGIEIYHRRGDHFHSDKINGYESVGEPLRFVKKGARIVAVKHGAFKAYPRR